MTGVAQAVSLQSMGAQEPRVVKLGDSVIRRASLKAARWKELRAARGGGFGSIARGGGLVRSNTDDSTIGVTG